MIEAMYLQRVNNYASVTSQLEMSGRVSDVKGCSKVWKQSTQCLFNESTMCKRF